MSGAFARGGGRADFELRVDLVALRAERLARVQAALRASPLDALLLWRDENVRYLTGLRAQIISGKSALLNGVFLADGHAPVLLCSGGEVDRVRAVMPWIEDARAIPIMEAAGLVREAVRGTLAPLVREAGAEAVGIDECAYAQVAELREALPGVALHDGDPLMQTCRVRKSDGELAVMEEAAAIAEGVTAAALDAVRPGVRELDIAGEALRALHRLGGETAHLATPFVASGERMAPPNRMATDKLVREGDLVFIDIGSMWNGYYSDLGRTTVCGAAVGRAAARLPRRPRRPAGRHRRHAHRGDDHRRGRRGDRRGARARAGRPFSEPVHRPRHRHGRQRAALRRRAAAGRRGGDARGGHDAGARAARSGCPACAAAPACGSRTRSR